MISFCDPIADCAVAKPRYIYINIYIWSTAFLLFAHGLSSCWCCSVPILMMRVMGSSSSSPFFFPIPLLLFLLRMLLMLPDRAPEMALLYIYRCTGPSFSILPPPSLDLDLISRPCYLGCSIVPLPPPLDGSLFSCTIPASITKNDGASRGGKKKTRVEVSSSVQRFIWM